MDLIMKIAAVGIIGSVLAVTVKEYKKRVFSFYRNRHRNCNHIFADGQHDTNKKFVWKYDYGGRHKQRVRFGYG